MTATPDGAPERIGRMLGHMVARGRSAARRAGEPESREKLAAAAKAAEAVARKKWAERGPDVAEVAAHRAVDRMLWALRIRSGFLAAALEPFAQQARDAAGRHARRLAETKPEDATAGDGDAPTPPAPPKGPV